MAARTRVNLSPIGVVLLATSTNRRPTTHVRRLAMTRTTNRIPTFARHLVRPAAGVLEKIKRRPLV
jgi:hypothetical protein